MTSSFHIPFTSLLTYHPTITRYVAQYNKAASSISHNWINQTQWNPQVTILFVHSTLQRHILVPIRTEMLSYLGKVNIFLLITPTKKLQKENSTVAVNRKGGFTNESLNIRLMAWNDIGYKQMT